MRMWKIVLASLTFLLCFSFSLSAQNPLWLQALEDTLNQGFTGLVTKQAYTSKQEVIIVGEYYNESLFHDFPSTSLGNDDLFVAKFEQVGNTRQVAWVNYMGSTSYDSPVDVVVDEMNNTYVLGAGKRTTFQGTGDTLPVEPYNGQINYVVKYDPNGVYQWSKLLSETGSIRFNQMVLSEGNQLLLTGKMESNTDHILCGDTLDSSQRDALLICELSASGSVNWAKTYLINGARYTPTNIRGITRLPSGDLVFSAHLNARGPYIELGGDRILGTNFIVRTDAQGNYQKHLELGMNGFISIQDILFHEDNQLLYGFANGGAPYTTRFGPLTVPGTNMGTNHIVFQMDQELNPRQLIQFGTEDSDQTYYFKLGENGLFVGSEIQEYEPGIIGTYIYNPQELESSSFVLKLDLGLNLQWFAHLEGSAYFHAFNGFAVSGKRLLASGIYGPTLIVDQDTLRRNSTTQSAIYLVELLDATKTTASRQLTGKVFEDGNRNGQQDVGEKGVSGISIWNEAAQSVALTDSTGCYQLAADPDSNRLRIMNLPRYWETIFPQDSVYERFYPSQQSGILDTLNFAIRPRDSIRDMSVTIAQVGPLRAGFPTTFFLDLENLGTEPSIKDTLWLCHDGLLTVDSASLSPFYQDEDCTGWIMDSIPPGGTRQIIVWPRVVVAPEGALTSVGRLLTAVAEIYPFSRDVDTLNNRDVWRRVITGSYDPNDKLVQPDAADHRVLVEEAKTLTYTIRFQNTGTDTAFNVVLLDTLDAQLDPFTVREIASSHPNQMQLSNDDGMYYLRWDFDHILLPDSFVNEPESHGFVRFQIDVKDDALQPGVQIENKADIYFDFNFPIRTNTTMTWLSEQRKPIADFDFTIDSARLYLQSKSLYSDELDWELGDGTRYGNEQQIVYEYNRAGDYPITLIAQNDCCADTANTVIVIQEIMTTSVDQLNPTGDLRVYPNPADQHLWIAWDGEAGAKLRYELFNAEGKSLRRGLVTKNDGDKMEVKSLPSGVYFLKLINSQTPHRIDVRKIIIQ